MTETHRRWYGKEHETKASMMEHMALSWLRSSGMSELSRARFGNPSFATEAAKNTAEMIFTLGLNEPGSSVTFMELYDFTADDLEAAFVEALKLDEEDVVCRQLVYMGVISAEDLAVRGRSILLQAW